MFSSLSPKELARLKYAEATETGRQAGIFDASK